MHILPVRAFILYVCLVILYMSMHIPLCILCVYVCVSMFVGNFLLT